MKKRGLLRDGLGNLSRFDALRRCNDAAIDPEGKKTVAARRASVRGSAQQAEHPGEHAHAVFARNALAVQVAAQPAVHVPDEAGRCGPRIKTRIADLAAPGTHTRDPHEVVLHAAPPGSPGAVAMAGRTKNRRSPLVSLHVRIRTFFAPTQAPGQLVLQRIPMTGSAATASPSHRRSPGAERPAGRLPRPSGPLPTKQGKLQIVDNSLPLEII